MRRAASTTARPCRQRPPAHKTNCLRGDNCRQSAPSLPIDRWPVATVSKQQCNLTASAAPGLRPSRHARHEYRQNSRTASVPTHIIACARAAPGDSLRARAPLIHCMQGDELSPSGPNSPGLGSERRQHFGCSSAGLQGFHPATAICCPLVQEAAHMYAEHLPARSKQRLCRASGLPALCRPLLHILHQPSDLFVRQPRPKRAGALVEKGGGMGRNTREARSSRRAFSRRTSSRRTAQQQCTQGSIRHEWGKGWGPSLRGVLLTGKQGNAYSQHETRNPPVPAGGGWGGVGRWRLHGGGGGHDTMQCMRLAEAIAAGAREGQGHGAGRPQPCPRAPAPDVAASTPKTHRQQEVPLGRSPCHSPASWRQAKRTSRVRGGGSLRWMGGAPHAVSRLRRPCGSDHTTYLQQAADGQGPARSHTCALACCCRRADPGAGAGAMTWATMAHDPHSCACWSSPRLSAHGRGHGVDVFATLCAWPWSWLYPPHLPLPL